MTTRKNIAVLFGGRSVEHEISVITALQLIEAMDVVRFNPIPVYIAPSGHWYTGEELLSREFYKSVPGSLEKMQEVTLFPHPDGGGLTILQHGRFPRRAVKTIAVDVYICAFHGQFGEDGCIQGLLELADATYSGCNVTASAIAMNKYLCKSILRAHDIPVLPGALVDKREVRKDLAAVRGRIIATPGLGAFPLFVKPCNLGSSIGISKVNNEQELDAALAKAFTYDTQVLVEPCVTKLLEINVSVLEGTPPVASVVECPVSDSGVLSYEEKYMRGGGKKGKAAASRGMASLTRVIDPQDLNSDTKERVREYALKAFSVLGCGGAVRFDFILDTGLNELYFNELNPLPGSLAFYLWVKSHPRKLYTEIINELIVQAEANKALRSGLKRNVGFKALLKS